MARESVSAHFLRSVFTIIADDAGRMMTKTLIVAVALIVTSTDAGMAQDVAKGEISFKKCVICHSIGPGAQNKVGPAQNGLDGRKAGSVPNYQYSDANKDLGIVWNEATFKEYIKDPKAKITQVQAEAVHITRLQAVAEFARGNACADGGGT